MAGFYAALGDSMSIDLYPALDLTAREGPDAASKRGIGAASLFHRNHPALWPEFHGRDLAWLYPGIQLRAAHADGATVAHTRDQQLARIGARVRAQARVVTLTAGGNDLLASLFDPEQETAGAGERVADALDELIDQALKAFRAATLILTTVYDPTDGTGHLPGMADDLGKLPLEELDRLNDRIRARANATPRTLLADAHAHFLGHGLTAPPEERWYWDPNPIEPGYRGASEIRRLWLDALVAVTP
jgi:lysophospholipase L1-like esterase